MQQVEVGLVIWCGCLRRSFLGGPSRFWGHPSRNALNWEASRILARAPPGLWPVGLPGPSLMCRFGGYWPVIKYIGRRKTFCGGMPWPSQNLPSGCWAIMKVGSNTLEASWVPNSCRKSRSLEPSRFGRLLQGFPVAFYLCLAWNGWMWTIQRISLGVDYTPGKLSMGRCSRSKRATSARVTSNNWL